ncbi:MAG: YdbL family protein [Gammaproteobacteria bacterium]|nr:YdbL family protein [Gammaproteobacteria bacterium]
MHTKPILQSLFLLLLLSLCGVASAAALSLGAAKQQGLVGEQYNGYLGAVASSPASTVRSLVAEINTKRRAQYNRIASTNKLALAEVEALAGKKSIAKTIAGNYVKAQGGSWRRK